MSAVAVATQDFTVQGDRNELLSSLEPAARFVSHHGSNAPVQNIHVVHSAADGYSRVEATDLRMSYRGHLWGTVSEPEAEVLINPRIIKAVKAMRAGPITLNRKGTEIEVTGSGKAKYTVPTSQGDFPNVLADWDTVDWAGVPAINTKDVLAEMNTAAKFVSRNETNPSITGVNLRVVDGKLGIDSTDGYRLFQSRVDLPHEGFPFGEDQVILPLSMVAELGKLFPTGEVKLGSTDNLFFATNPAGDIAFACRRIGGKFPDTDKLMPDFQVSVQLPRTELDDALSRLRSVADPKKPVALDVGKDEVKLTARGEDGAAEEYVELVAPNGDPIVIGFNLEHLASGVALFDTDEVKLSFVSNLRPALLSNDTDRTFLVIPVRLT